MRECAECGGRLDEAFRFCPWCAAPQRRKLVELFPATETVDADRGKSLRVSRYVDEGHVRFSVWDGIRAEAAVSVDDTHLARLRRLLGDPRPSRATLLEQVVERVRLPPLTLSRRR